MAKRVLMPPDDAAPIFDGFTKETFKFLHDLNKNNNKAWFDAHRDEYEMQLRNPCKALVQSMAMYFRNNKLPFAANEKTSLFRINRDIRFSKNKDPYKTHIGVVFPLEKSSSGEWCGMYFGMEPAQKGKGMKAYIGGGAWMPEPPYLKKIRAKIATDFKKFEKLLNEKNFRKVYPGGIDSEETLKRIPQGYSEDDPAAKWLKLKSFTMNSELSDADLLNEDLPDVIGSRIESALPMISFLGRG